MRGSRVYFSGGQRTRTPVLNGMALSCNPHRPIFSRASGCLSSGSVPTHTWLIHARLIRPPPLGEQPAVSQLDCVNWLWRAVGVAVEPGPVPPSAPSAPGPQPGQGLVAVHVRRNARRLPAPHEAVVVVQLHCPAAAAAAAVPRALRQAAGLWQDPNSERAARGDQDRVRVPRRGHRAVYPLDSGSIATDDPSLTHPCIVLDSSLTRL